MKIGSLDLDTRFEYLIIYKDKRDNSINTWTLGNGFKSNYSSMKKTDYVDILGVYKKLSNSQIDNIVSNYDNVPMSGLEFRNELIKRLNENADRYVGGSRNCIQYPDIETFEVDEVYEIIDRVLDGSPEDDPMHETIKIWFEELYKKEIENVKRIINNKRLWKLGYDSQEQINPHTESIEMLIKYRRMLKEKLEELK